MGILALIACIASALHIEAGAYAMTGKDDLVNAMIEERVSELLKEYDMDRNGVLDEDEAMQVLLITFDRMRGDFTPDEEDLAGWFESFDTNVSGDLSKDELFEFLSM